MGRVAGEITAILGGDSSNLRDEVAKGNRALDSVGDHARRAAVASSGSLSGMAAGAGKAALAFLGLRSVVTLTSAGLTALLTGPIRQAGELREFADAVGSTTRELTRLRFAASQAGIDDGQLRQQLTFLAGKLDEARDKGSQAAAVFKGLGVDTTRGAVEAYKQLSGALANVEDRQKAVALARDVFGGRSGPRALALGHDYDELAAKADKLGITLDDDLAKRADEASDKLSALGDVIGALARTGVEPLINSLGRGADRLSEFLTQDPRGIELAQRAVKLLAGALDEVTEPETLAKLRDLSVALGNAGGALVAIGKGAFDASPGIKALADSLTAVAAGFNSLPKELQAAAIGYAVRGPAGAAFGAGAALGSRPGLQPLADVLSQKAAEFFVGSTEPSSLDARNRERFNKILAGREAKLQALRAQTRGGLSDESRAAILGSVGGSETAPFSTAENLPRFNEGQPKFSAAPTPFTENFDNNSKVKAAQAEAAGKALDAQREKLETLASLHEKELATAAKLGKAESEQLRIAELIKSDKLGAIDAEEKALNAKAAALKKSTEGEANTAEQKADQVKATAELAEITEKLKAQDIKRQIVLAESADTVRGIKGDTTELAARLAAIDAQAADIRAGTQVKRTNTALDRATAGGESFSTRLQLAAAADAAEQQANIGKANALREQLSILDAKKEKTAEEIHQLDVVKAQFEDINAEIALGPDRVRAMTREFKTLGGVISDTLGDLAQGFATNPLASLSDLSQRASQTLLGNIAKNSGPQIKDAFEATAKKAVDSAKQAFGDIFGSARSSSQTSGLPTLESGTGAAAAPKPTPVTVVPSGPRLSAEEAAAIGVDAGTAFRRGRASTPQVSQDGGGVDLATGIAAVGAAAISTATTIVGGLQERRNKVEELLQQQARLTNFVKTNKGQVKTFAGLGFHVPKAERQFAIAVNEAFDESLLPKAAPSFRNDDVAVLGRDLPRLQATTPALAGRILAGSTSPEQVRGLAADIAPILTRGNEKLAHDFTNILIQNARILGLSAEQTSEQLSELVNKGLDLSTAIKLVNKDFFEGRRTLEQYHTGLSAIVTLLASPDFKAVDAGALAARLSIGGIVDPQAISSLVNTAQAAVTGGISDAFSALLDGGSASQAGAAIGAKFGTALVQEATDKILHQNIGKFLTEASVDFSQATDALIAGDTAEFQRLKALGLADFAKGKKEALSFVKEVAPGIRSIVRDLTSGGSSGVIDQADLINLPSMDSGGIVPGAFGRPYPIMAHGGEPIIPLNQSSNFLNKLNVLDRLASVLETSRDGGPSSVTLNVDGRNWASIDLRNERLQRTGAVLPNASIGVD